MTRRYTILALLLAMCCSMWATVPPRKPGMGKPLPDAELVDESGDAQSAPRRIGSQATAPLKAKGSPKIPVILVQFSDCYFKSGLGTTTNAAGEEVKDSCDTDAKVAVVNAFYDKFCNGDGKSDYYTGAGSHGAIKEYFRDQSNGQFTPEFTVIGPVTVPNGYGYYGKNGTGSKDINMTDFYKHALTAAQAIHTSWSDFDNDGNGVIDMAFFIYAGEGENGDGTDDSIWPKEQRTGGTLNDMKYGCYACCNEMYEGETDGIGVFCHELSHAMGLPDFYDTGYVAYGMDYWDIMDSGCYCNDGYTPCNYTAYERAFMGWQDLVELTAADAQKEITLQSTSDYGVGYKIVNPANANEYYVLENRQNKGWDMNIGHGSADLGLIHGMLVSHVDFNQSLWNTNKVNTNANHQYMTVVPADGVLDSYMYVDNFNEYVAFLKSAYGDLYPGYQKVTELSGEKQYVYTSTGDTPHQMNQPILDIKEHEDGTITFFFMDYPTLVNSLFANEKSGVPVYDLSGVQHGTTSVVNGKPQRLPAAAGTYIVDGKKFIVR